jgi:4-amino-4-deoxy-L-arabinose transferase-like glycosyltransferase
MPNYVDRYRLLPLAALAAVFFGFFFNLHTVPLFDLDEGAFSEATREMLERRDFVSTFLNGAPRYDKPILIYWLQAASVSAFGINELAFRLPSALAATAWVAAVFAFTRRLRDARSAWYAAIMTATCLQIALIGRAAIADALLNLWLVVTMFAVYLYYAERRARWLFAAFAGMALGVLTKGPVAVLIPLAVSLLYFVLRGEWRAWLRAAFNPAGIALFLLIALPWYVAQYLKEGQAFIDGFFFTHNIGRFEGPMEGHGGSLLYYVPVVLVGLLPYTTVALTTLARLRTLLRDPLNQYLLLWAGFVVVFFSLSGTKLPHYVIYGYTGLIVVMAGLLDEARSRLANLLPALLFLGLLLVLPEILAKAAAATGDAHTRNVLTDAGAQFPAGYRVLLAVAAGAVIAGMIDRRLRVSLKLLLAGIACVAAFNGLLLPAAGAIQQSPIKEAAAIARERGYEVVMWRLNMPSFNVYSRSLVAKHRPGPGEVVLTKTIYVGELPGVEVIYEKNGIVMGRVKGG